MDSRSLGLIIACICLWSLILHSPVEAKGAKAKIVKEYCKPSKNFDYCQKVMTQSVHNLGRKKCDLTTLTKLTLQFAKEGSVLVADFFKKVTPFYPQFATPLKQCASFFESSIDNLERLPAMEGGTATLDVYHAMDLVKECELELANAKVVIPDVTAGIQFWKNRFELAYTGVEACEIEYENKLTGATRV